MSGFFFCGNIEEPVVKASLICTKPNSWLLHSTSSSPIRDRWIAQFADDVYRALDPEVAVERRQLIGGPSRARVQAELSALRARLTERGLQASQVAQEFGAPG